ncbi:aromatic acid exporter family protein [Anoxybacillus sp. J5B_2022]|uniref:aromatic acid exporter family protein n=1 Tax=Anoxybacillus sp. J5B_2022 TaxID=3003246 RepID=UPI0022855405|nr:aromatic acid exporter family protein [Anoxybacillus sp. J5B_2022]MCZ0756460.1 aromatic acid exporter family protein [Anoxybacillus sp. J5B_2022]
MLKIGYRTAKTAIGTALSISIAQWLGLHNFASAGIITLLCIQVTKKKSLQTAWARFVACVIAMLFSFVFFKGIAYHPWTIGLLLLTFIPVTVRLKVTDGIATSSVIILHFYAAKQFTLPIVVNELLLIIIGIGVALLVNLYMPSVEKELKEYQRIIEDLFRIIFKEIVRYLRTNESSWDGKELALAVDVLQKAKQAALRNMENHVLRNEEGYYHYFRMREKQLEIMERVLPLVTSLTYTVDQRNMIADFIDELSDAIHPGNTADRFLRQLNEMKKRFETMPLPKTREEFEERAALFHLVKELEQYLIIKSQFRAPQ